MNTSQTREPMACSHCGHTIRENESVLADLPRDVPEELSRAAFRHWHMQCRECNAGVSCYQAYASSQTAFVAQTSTACAWCGDAIGQGELELRETLWVWKLSGVREERTETAGGFLGIGKGAKVRPPTSFKDLPFRLKQKFFTAGLGNGRGFRTFAEAQDFYVKSVPRSVRNMGPEAVRDFVNGRHASHFESVANAPGKAKIPSNMTWENPLRNIKRGAANMNLKDRMLARGLNRMNAVKGVGKASLGNAGRASMMAALVEIPVSAAEGAIRVVKGKKSREEATKDAVMNTARAGLAGGVAAAGFTVVVAFGAGPALSAASPILVPLGVAIYGVSTYRRIGDAFKNDEPLRRIPLYFHADCGECGDGASCFESFAEKVSENSQ